MKKFIEQLKTTSKGAFLLMGAGLLTGCMSLSPQNTVSQNSAPRTVLGQSPSTAGMRTPQYGGQQYAIMPASYQQSQAPANLSPRITYPDEYLLDGGDRDAPIHYDEQHRLGLDTEDTIAEFYDHKGKHEVKSTNTVAIYSPRFATLRTISSPVDGTAIEKLGSLDQKNMGTELYNRDAVVSHHENLRVNSARMRLRPSALGSDSMAMSADKTLKPNLDHSIQSAYLNLEFIHTGRVQQTEEAMLAAAIDSAKVWSRSQNPVVAGSISHAQEVQTQFYGAEMVGVDDSHKQKGDLRIVKLADKKTAQPGDIITFTIRYDNLGDRELKHIRIVDNLTSRLEYVPDSASSDREGDLVLEDNGEGSLVVKFEIKKPLKGHEGGVVSFKAKVR